MKKIFIFVCSAVSVLAGCRSVQFDNETFTSGKRDADPLIGSRTEEQNADQKEMRDFEVENEMKEVDVDKSVVYVAQPVYQPAPEEREQPAAGKDAVKKSTDAAAQMPDKFIHGTMYYDFSDDFVYEIYAQPYRTTDIMLEPGEQLLEMPFMSENQVWVLGAGVSRMGNLDVQHFFVKPVYSGLVTSMIIITDKRVYHILLKSYKDAYMTIVRWNYPNSMPFTVKTDAMQSQINKLTMEKTGVDPKYLSFDYKMTYSLFHKPVWLPTLVYDDGARTYIRMNPTVLHRASPVMFDGRNNIINYRTDGNLIILDQLIEKVTLRYNKERVTIVKKNYNPKKDPDRVLPQDAEAEKPKSPYSKLVIGTEAAEEQRIMAQQAQNPESTKESKVAADKAVQAAAQAQAAAQTAVQAADAAAANSGAK